MSINESGQKRKRGGQPGNQNARKHGFYTKEGRRKIEEVDAFLEDCNAILRGMASGDFSELRGILASRLSKEQPRDGLGSA